MPLAPLVANARITIPITVQTFQHEVHLWTNCEEAPGTHPSEGTVHCEDPAITEVTFTDAAEILQGYYKSLYADTASIGTPRVEKPTDAGWQTIMIALISPVAGTAAGANAVAGMVTATYKDLYNVRARLMFPEPAITVPIYSVLGASYSATWNTVLSAFVGPRGLGDVPDFVVSRYNARLLYGQHVSSTVSRALRKKRGQL